MPDTPEMPVPPTPPPAPPLATTNLPMSIDSPVVRATVVAVSLPGNATAPEGPSRPPPPPAQHSTAPGASGGMCAEPDAITTEPAARDQTPVASERPAELLEWYPSRPAMFEHLKKLSFAQGHSIKTLPGPCGSNNKKAVYVCASYPEFQCSYYVCAVKHRGKDEDGAFESWGPRRRRGQARPDNFCHSTGCPSVRTMSYKELARLPAVVSALRDNPDMKLKHLAAVVTESGVPVSALAKKEGAAHQFLYRAMKIARGIALGKIPSEPAELEAAEGGPARGAGNKKRRTSAFALEDRLAKWVAQEVQEGRTPKDAQMEAQGREIGREEDVDEGDVLGFSPAWLRRFKRRYGLLDGAAPRAGASGRAGAGSSGAVARVRLGGDAAPHGYGKARVTTWLRELEAGDETIAGFAEEEMDVEALSAASEAELQALGISKMGHRKKLLKWARAADAQRQFEK